jgi:hypothetical protein
MYHACGFITRPVLHWKFFGLTKQEDQSRLGLAKCIAPCLDFKRSMYRYPIKMSSWCLLTVFQKNMTILSLHLIRLHPTISLLNMSYLTFSMNSPTILSLPKKGRLYSRLRRNRRGCCNALKIFCDQSCDGPVDPAASLKTVRKVCLGNVVLASS